MILYEAYNENNGRAYIGLTTKTLGYRKSQHLRSAKSGSMSHFHKAIRKHGKEAFSWDVITVCDSLESLYEKEKMCISLYEPWQLYNKSLGGEHSAYGMKHTEETKEMCRQASVSRWDGHRARDVYPHWVFDLPTYKEAKKYGIPKTTWYRERKHNPFKECSTEGPK